MAVQNELVELVERQKCIVKSSGLRYMLISPTEIYHRTDYLFKHPKYANGHTEYATVIKFPFAPICVRRFEVTMLVKLVHLVVRLNEK